MPDDGDDDDVPPPPEDLALSVSDARTEFREWLLEEMKKDPGLDTDELGLFELYEKEHSQTIERMLQVEREFVKEQQDAGVDVPNDSGFVAVEYFIKRFRYSDIIYLASLLEMFLEHSCEKLKRTLGYNSIIHFEPNELRGDKWNRHKKFLERYGQFQFGHVWADLSAMLAVRNNLVHDNGSTSAMSDEEKKRFAQLPGVSEENGCLTIEREFVLQSLSALRRLAEVVNERLAQIIDRALHPRSVPPLG